MRGRPKLPARIVNYSPKGALLEVERPPWLPFRFELQISGLAEPICCELRHVTSHGIGVIFHHSEGRSQRPESDLRAMDFDEWMGPVMSVLRGGTE